MSDLFARAIKEGRELRARKEAETGQQKAEDAAKRKLRMDTVPEVKSAVEPTLREAAAALCGEKFHATLIELDDGLRIIPILKS
jgi:hypothetical protein